jgi:hypothetical protein
MAYIIPVIIEKPHNQDELKKALSLARKNLARLNAFSSAPDPDPYVFPLTITKAPDDQLARKLKQARITLDRLLELQDAIND